MKKDRFKRVYVEIGNVCNMSCVFCPKTSRQPKQMSVDEFKVVLSKIKDYTSHIYLHIMGEPLIHPNLAELLDEAYGSGLKVNITTNGTLLSQNKAILQHKSIRKISISIHSFEANVMNKTLVEYLDSVVDFAKSLSKDKYIELRLWNVDNENYSKLNDDIIEYIKSSFNYTEKLDRQSKLSIAIANNVYIMFAHKFDWPNVDGEDYGEKGFCHGLKDQIGVLVSGDVVPCCLDNEGTIVLGNIFSDSMEQILSNPRTQAIIEGFRNRKRVENLCRHCEYATRFNK